MVLELLRLPMKLSRRISATGTTPVFQETSWEKPDEPKRVAGLKRPVNYEIYPCQVSRKDDWQFVFRFQVSGFFRGFQGVSDL